MLSDWETRSVSHFHILLYIYKNILLVINIIPVAVAVNIYIE